MSSTQPNSTLRFDGKVAIITGAGNSPSLGQAYARLLAERGASVVVNDIGGGRGAADAAAVADDICRAGGSAVADTNSVADRDSAMAVVETALSSFGAVDILINNAGINRPGLFDEISENDIRRIVDVHLMGTMWMAQAVWPLMKKQGYGRIVNITSEATFGYAFLSVYGAAKAAVLGLARSLAVEGQPLGIKVNSVAPEAGGAQFDDDDWAKGRNEQYPPELVSPAVALLSHERCPCSGKLLKVSGGRVQEICFAATQGYEDRAMTVDDVLANWDCVADRADVDWLPDAVEFVVPPWATRAAVER